MGCSEHHSQRFLSRRVLNIAISLLERALYVSYNPLGGTGPAPEVVSGPKLFLTWVGHYDGRQHAKNLTVSAGGPRQF